MHRTIKGAVDDAISQLEEELDDGKLALYRLEEQIEGLNALVSRLGRDRALLLAALRGCINLSPGWPQKALETLQSLGESLKG